MLCCHDNASDFVTSPHTDSKPVLSGVGPKSAPVGTPHQLIMVQLTQLSYYHSMSVLMGVIGAYDSWSFRDAMF